MKSKNELNTFFEISLTPMLEELEGDRKRLLKKVILVESLFGLAIVAIIFILYSLLSIGSVDILFGIGGLAFPVGFFIYKFLIKGYVGEFKDKIISPLVSEIDEGLKYSQNEHLSQETVDKSDLFKKADKISGNDLVVGRVDDVNIEFSDVHTQSRHRDSKGKTKYSTIFKGLFIRAEFNKHFIGKTLVLPDMAQSKFGDFLGGWLQSNNMSRDELVKMDSVDFEKEFVIYSTDQIEARYILSFSIMEKLLELRENSKHPIYISFHNEFIHVAIEYEKDMFEPTVFKTLLDDEVAKEYVSTLHLTLGIVQELKLNEKLWSKV